MPSDSPEAAVANSSLQPTAHENLTVETEFEALGVGEDEVRADREGEGSVIYVEEKQGGTKEFEGKRRGRRAAKANARSDGSGSKSREGEGSEEEEDEEAVAVIAQVLIEKFGHQIVREEVYEGAGFGASEEGSSGTTSRSTRATSRSSLRSFYRFFSSHLGISSPSTVASLLASNPQLLRSNPTNDFLPRVRLLQFFGVSHADIVHISVREPAWLRVSLPRIQNTLEFLLAQGVRRSRLGSVLRRGRNLLSWEARSTNLDVLVEKAGVPVDKLGGIIENIPSILTRSNEAVIVQLEILSAYLKAGCRGKVEADSTRTSLLRQRLDEPLLDTSQLSRVILRCPSIFSTPPYRIAENIAILQSFTPPGTPSIATSVLQRAPAILSFNKETLLAKLQFFVELGGEKAAGRMVRRYPTVLNLSKENVQGKVAVLVDLIGQENAVRVVAQFPLLIASSEVVLRESFRELAREVEEVLESSGEEGSGTQSLVKGECGSSLDGANELRSSNSAKSDKRCRACELVADLVVRYPQSINCSWKTNLKHKVEYLKWEMGLSIMEVLTYPSFLTFSLDRRIRPRHVALVRMGYVVVAREMVSWTSVGDRGDSIEAGKQKSKLGSVSDNVEGVEGELGAEERKGGPLSGAVLSNAELGERVVSEQQLVNLEATQKAVCLRQFLQWSDKLFEEKFGVKL